MTKTTNKKIILPKEIPVGTSKKESDVMWCLKGKKRALFYSTTAQRDAIMVMRKECNDYESLIKALQYDRTAQNIVRYFQQAGIAYENF